MMADKPWKQNERMNRTTERTESEREIEEPNPLAVVSSNSDPLVEPEPTDTTVVLAQRVRKEETESKISAWEAEELAKIDSRFKRQEAIINGWEADQIETASAWLKKFERKIEEKRANVIERTQNEVAMTHQKSEEKRGSIEAKRGEKVAKVLELAKLMKIVGRSPSKRSFFKSSKQNWP